MSDARDEAKLLALWAAGVEVSLAHSAPHAGGEGGEGEAHGAARSGRARLIAALEAERYLPFCAELARHVDLSEHEVRALLARSANPKAWTRSVPPVAGYIDFEPGPKLLRLRAGFVRLLGGARLPQHEHPDRELTFVLEGELVDDHERSYTPGSVIDMPVGSAHALSVPEEGSATVVLLHGRLRGVAQDDPSK